MSSFPSNSSILYYSQVSSFGIHLAILFTLTCLVHLVGSRIILPLLEPNTIEHICCTGCYFSSLS